LTVVAWAEAPGRATSQHAVRRTSCRVVDVMAGFL
jgi:hypothetical protein